MLEMRTFRLDQPSYIFFDITWGDLMVMGLIAAFAGFLSTIFQWSPVTMLLFIMAGGGLGYIGKKVFLLIFPHGTHRHFWAWLTQEAYFYDYAPDPVALPLVIKDRQV